MYRAGERSWRIHERRWDPLIDLALWVRAAERLEVPADELTPGPIELEPPPSPTVMPGVPGPDRAELATEWAGWWRSLVVPDRTPAPPADPVPEPAYDTPDPLGLATRPRLRVLVARRWPEATAWSRARERAGTGALPPFGRSGQVVRQVERSLGRRIRPFSVELLLLPVRDDVIRRAYDHRYLVPEWIYDDEARWTGWLGDLLGRIA